MRSMILCLKPVRWRALAAAASLVISRTVSVYSHHPASSHSDILVASPLPASTLAGH